MTVFDVTDPNAPRGGKPDDLRRQLPMTRAVDGVVYLVLDTPFDLPELQVHRHPCGAGRGGGRPRQGIVSKPAPWSSEITGYHRLRNLG